MIKCDANHVGNESIPWRCPKCGKGNEFFFVLESDPLANSACDMLHKNDYVICENCDYKANGNQVANELHYWTACSCCKGSGLMPKE